MSSNEGWLTMGDKTPERKGLLWWIEHENTNEAWTMKNPWAVGAIVLTILIVLCMLATFFWGLPRPVANVIVNVAFYGYWGVLLAFEIKAKHRVAAAGTAFTWYSSPSYGGYELSLLARSRRFMAFGCRRGRFLHEISSYKRLGSC